MTAKSEGQEQKQIENRRQGEEQREPEAPAKEIWNLQFYKYFWGEQKAKKEKISMEKLWGGGFKKERTFVVPAGTPGKISGFCGRKETDTGRDDSKRNLELSGWIKSQFLF